MDPGKLVEGAYNFAQVFAAEADEIAAQCDHRGVEPDLDFDRKRADGKHEEAGRIPDRLGLALSGGGIRSASVALGVVQALAKRRMLRQAHYISGVSGGGYLLGWLSAWICRQDSCTEKGEKKLQERHSFDQVEEQLAHNSSSGRREDVAAPPLFRRHIEPFPIHYLRRYTSYLTPRMGLFSGDLLAAISIYLRNVLLNMIMVGCLAVALMLMVQFPAFLNSVWELRGVLCRGFLFWLVPMVFISLFTTGTGVASYSLYQVTDFDSPELRWAGLIVITCGVLACATIWLFLPGWYIYTAATGQKITLFAVMGLVVIGIAGAIPYYISGYRDGDTVHSVERRGWLNAILHFLAWVVVGGGGIALHFLLYRWLHSGNEILVPQSYGVFGFPALLLALSVLSYIWVGIMGGSMPDAQREWLGRAAGYFLAYAAVSALAFNIAFYGPVAMHLLFSFARAPWAGKVLTIILPGGWLFTVLTGLIGGKSPKTDGQKPAPLGIGIAIALAPASFVAGVLLLTAWGTNQLIVHTVLDCQKGTDCNNQYVPWAGWHKVPPKPVTAVILTNSAVKLATDAKPGDETVLLWRNEGRQPVLDKPNPLEFQTQVGGNPANGKVGLYGAVWLAFAVAGAFLGLRLNVNEFSEHLFYRNRLVRAFLGASHPDAAACGRDQPRRANKFTGFAYDDDIFLKNLVAEKGFHGPYPIWGTCLNLTTGEDLAWQKRKGASFIYSPLFCGWDYVSESQPPKQLEGPDKQEKSVRRCSSLVDFGYRSTRPNGPDPSANGYVTGYGGDGGAPLIGTAMAASGAAISPNWGYHTRPAIAVLLTLFNVRLGWWTGNPRHIRTWKKYAPSIFYLAAELIGNASDKRGYVNLSDGGHFENLGIYELVRRRVRFIICSDADADPQFQFEDLGKAIAQCRRDFGVEIRLGAERTITVSKEPVFRQAHYAVGVIVYPGQDEKGLLLYMKSSLTNDEPSDVLATRAGHPNFPHDTTLNQFFDEQLFESYRALGEHIMSYLIDQSGALMAGTPADGDKVAGPRVRAFYYWLRQQAI